MGNTVAVTVDRGPVLRRRRSGDRGEEDEEGESKPAGQDHEGKIGPAAPVAPPRSKTPLPAAVLTCNLIPIHTYDMTVKRITANLPEALLEEAMETTGKGITETLAEGLELVRRTRAYRKALALRGKIDLDLDLEVSRERRPRR